MTDADPNTHTSVMPAKQDDPPRSMARKLAPVGYTVYSLRLTLQQIDALRALAARTGIPTQSHIRMAIIEYLERQEQPHAAP